MQDYVASQSRPLNLLWDAVPKRVHSRTDAVRSRRLNDRAYAVFEPWMLVLFGNAQTAG